MENSAKKNGHPKPRAVKIVHPSYQPSRSRIKISRS